MKMKKENEEKKMFYQGENEDERTDLSVIFQGIEWLGLSFSLVFLSRSFPQARLTDVFFLSFDDSYR